MLALAGGRVLLACRSKARCDGAARSIRLAISSARGSGSVEVRARRVAGRLVGIETVEGTFYGGGGTEDG